MNRNPKVIQLEAKHTLGYISECTHKSSDGVPLLASENRLLAYLAQPLQITDHNTTCKTAFFAAVDEVCASLPCIDPAPERFEECIATGAYDLRSCSPEERASGAHHSAQVLHIPGRSTILLLSASTLYFTVQCGLLNRLLHTQITVHRCDRHTHTQITDTQITHTGHSSFFLLYFLFFMAFYLVCSLFDDGLWADHSDRAWCRAGRCSSSVRCPEQAVALLLCIVLKRMLQGHITVINFDLIPGRSTFFFITVSILPFLCWPQQRAAGAHRRAQLLGLFRHV